MEKEFGSAPVPIGGAVVVPIAQGKPTTGGTTTIIESPPRERHFPNWIEAFMQFCTHSEAPSHVNWWTAISTIAGVLGRRAWIDMRDFKWFPNQYIVIVGPPEIIAKSTTMGKGMKLLQEVYPECMGPTSCTYPAFLKWLAGRECKKDFGGTGRIETLQYGTCSASELGTLIKTDDKEMLDTLINLWDGDKVDKQVIREFGSVCLEKPLLNLNGCTTPEWIERSISRQLAEGGLFTRMLFIYADKKAKRVAYPDEVAPQDYDDTRRKLMEDLSLIGELEGPFTLTEEARALGRTWYGDILDRAEQGIPLMRKQPHAHKLAIVLSAACRTDRMITAKELKRAIEEIEKIETYRQKVLESVGRHVLAPISNEIIQYIASMGTIDKSAVFRHFLPKIPNKTDFENLLSATIESGRIKMVSLMDGKMIRLSVNNSSE